MAAMYYYISPAAAAARKMPDFLQLPPAKSANCWGAGSRTQTNQLIIPGAVF